MVLIPSQQRAFITLTNANNWIPGPGVSSTELIPKGVMHRPRAPERTVILMVERAGIVPTGT